MIRHEFFKICFFFSAQELFSFRVNKLFVFKAMCEQTRAWFEYLYYCVKPRKNKRWNYIL